ncbi:MULTISPECIES: DUF6230 family protein [unclassified Janibacter]|uniref:DUF6230 family protein n=1 Tax=unclassified Janibacter TaxID=2649294 RepID=UPI003CFE1606
MKCWLNDGLLRRRRGRLAQLASSGLEGSDVGLGMATTTRSTGSGTTTDTKYVVRAGLADGKLDGLCLSQTQTVGGAAFTIFLRGGDGTLGTYEIAGKNAVLDVTNLRAAAQTGSAGNGIVFDGRVLMGVSGDDITTTATGGVADRNPLEVADTIGWYGIDADKGTIYNFTADVYDLVIGGPFSMPGLSIQVVAGSTGCKSTALPK